MPAVRRAVINHISFGIDPFQYADVKAALDKRGLNGREDTGSSLKIDDPKLPEGKVDLVILVDVYHEFSHPFEMMQGIVKSLKPGGRLAFAEYRAVPGVGHNP